MWKQTLPGRKTVGSNLAPSLTWPWQPRGFKERDWQQPDGRDGEREREGGGRERTGGWGTDRKVLMVKQASWRQGRMRGVKEGRHRGWGCWQTANVHIKGVAELKSGGTKVKSEIWSSSNVKQDCYCAPLPVTWAAKASNTVTFASTNISQQSSDWLPDT